MNFFYQSVYCGQVGFFFRFMMDACVSKWMYQAEKNLITNNPVIMKAWTKLNKNIFKTVNCRFFFIILLLLWMRFLLQVDVFFLRFKIHFIGAHSFLLFIKWLCVFFSGNIVFFLIFFRLSFSDRLISFTFNLYFWYVYICVYDTV